MKYFSIFCFFVVLSRFCFSQSLFNKDVSPESPFAFGTSSLTKSNQTAVIYFPGSSGEIEWIDFGYSLFEESLNNKQLTSNSGYLVATLHPAGNHLISFTDLQLKQDGKDDYSKQQFLYSFSFPVKYYQNRIGISMKYNILNNFSADSISYSGYDLGMDAGYYQTNIFPELSIFRDDYLDGGFRFGATVKNLVQYSELHEKDDREKISVIKNAPDLVLGFGYLPVSKTNLSAGIGYLLMIQSNNKNKFESLKSNSLTRYNHQFSGHLQYKNWSLDLSNSSWVDSIDNQTTLALGFHYRNFRFLAGRNYYSNQSTLFLTCQLNYKEKMN